MSSNNDFPGGFEPGAGGFDQGFGDFNGNFDGTEQSTQPEGYNGDGGNYNGDGAQEPPSGGSSKVGVIIAVIVVLTLLVIGIAVGVGGISFNKEEEPKAPVPQSAQPTAEATQKEDESSAFERADETATDSPTGLPSTEPALPTTEPSKEPEAVESQEPVKDPLPSTPDVTTSKADAGNQLTPITPGSTKNEYVATGMVTEKSTYSFQGTALYALKIMVSSENGVKDVIFFAAQNSYDSIPVGGTLKVTLSEGSDGLLTIKSVSSN